MDEPFVKIEIDVAFRTAAMRGQWGMKVFSRGFQLPFIRRSTGSHMPNANIDARALLRRCCVGHERGDCEGSGRGRAGGRAAPTLRDRGTVSGAGVFAPAVARDLAAIAGDPLPGNAVRLLEDGVESFGAMLELARGARNEVCFENFIFRMDEVGRAFAEELKACTEAGIRVRVLHDPGGVLMSGRPPVNVLFHGSSAEVRLFSLSWPTRSALRLGRDHRKLVVADRSRMVAGGMCLADPWVGNCVRHCTWRDSAVYVEGPAAAAGAHAFDRTWRNSRRLGRASVVPSEPPSPGAPAAGDVPVRIVTDIGPTRRTEALLARAIEAARRHVLVTSPCFLPPDGLSRALMDAVSRGVEVAVLLPGRNNHPVVQLSAEERLGKLLRRGVEVFRWQGAMIHAKSVVVDGEWTLVGSSNLDALSLRRNTELNVEVHGSAVGHMAERVFRENCRESMPFTLGDWRHRSRRRRAAARLASTLAAWQ